MRICFLLNVRVNIMQMSTIDYAFAMRIMNVGRAIRIRSRLLYHFAKASTTVSTISFYSMYAYTTFI